MSDAVNTNENGENHVTEQPAAEAPAEAATEREPREARRGGRERNPSRDRGGRDREQSQFLERVVTINRVSKVVKMVEEKLVP